jgi:hypothetical protein
MLKIALMLGLGVVAILIPQAASAGQPIRQPAGQPVMENGFYDFQLGGSPPRSLAATNKSRPSIGATSRRSTRK